MDIIGTLREFGWLGFFMIWALDKLFPRFWSFLTDKVFPQRVRERAARLEIVEEESRAKRESEATLLKSKIERELRDEEHRRKMEERMVEAQEKVASSVNQMTLAITINNEKLAQLISSHADHDRFTVAAVGDMRTSVIQLHKRESQTKIKRPPRSSKQ